MRRITEGQYALGALTVFAVWVFFGLPLLAAYQAAQFAVPPEYAKPHESGDGATDHKNNKSEPSKTVWERIAVLPERTIDDPVAFFTAWLVAFTGVLAVSTVFLWSATKRTALIAERAMTELEAPFISIKIIEPGIQWNQAARAVTGGMLRFTYINYGRTPATIFESFEDFRAVMPGDGLPRPINARNERGAPMPWGVVAPPDGKETEPFTFNIFAGTLIEASRNPNILRDGIPFFLGFVMFGDIFGNLYTLGFCFLFDRNGNRFVLAGGDEYNYCRKERGPYRPPGANRAAAEPPLPPEPADAQDVDLIEP
jgi:hypothetical protein